MTDTKNWKKSFPLAPIDCMSSDSNPDLSPRPAMLFDAAHPDDQGFLVPIDPWRAGSNRRQLRRLVGDALDRGEREIVMDCKAWNSPDVVLLSTLVGCADLCAQQGANFRLVNLDGSMHETLRELRLTSRLGLME